MGFRVCRVQKVRPTGSPSVFFSPLSLSLSFVISFMFCFVFLFTFASFYACGRTNTLCFFASMMMLIMVTNRCPTPSVPGKRPANQTPIPWSLKGNFLFVKKFSCFAKGDDIFATSGVFVCWIFVCRRVF